jgi:hypothetical protein
MTGVARGRLPTHSAYNEVKGRSVASLDYRHFTDMILMSLKAIPPGRVAKG